jgi:3-oxoacyl-[acyl-carrier-protein] synthase II
MKRRVVVTGLGLVTPLGTGVEASWAALIAGQCGVRSLPSFSSFSVHTFPSRVAANVIRGKKPGEFDIDQWVDKKEQQNTPAFVQFALAAAEQALTDAAWRPTTLHEQETTVGKLISSTAPN